jgi:hypothetical protein
MSADSPSFSFFQGKTRHLLTQIKSGHRIRVDHAILFALESMHFGVWRHRQAQ